MQIGKSVDEDRRCKLCLSGGFPVAVDPINKSKYSRIQKSTGHPI
jgi:hypothetical protein